MISAAGRVSTLFEQAIRTLRERTDHMFAWLLLAEWIAGVSVALFLSPLSWSGRSSTIHLHVWAALILGGLITVFPAYLAYRRPGQALTRHLVAAGQMAM